MSETCSIKILGIPNYNRLDTPLITSGGSGGIINPSGKLWTPQSGTSTDLPDLYLTTEYYDLSINKLKVTDPILSAVTYNVIVRSISIWVPVIVQWAIDMPYAVSAVAGSTWTFYINTKTTAIYWPATVYKCYIRWKLFKNGILFLSNTEWVSTVTFTYITSNKNTGQSFSSGDQLKLKIEFGYFASKPF